jgi:DNA-binding LytR/AlgR family response regulator
MNLPRISPFHVLILENQKPISRNLEKDLKFIGAGATSIRRVFTPEEAYTEIEIAMPNLVILSLDLPEQGATQFFQKFPPEQRPFSVIIINTPSANPSEQMKLMQIVAEQHISYYLPLRLFGNETLKRAVNSVRRTIQQQYISEYQEEIIQSFIRSLKHPLFKLAENTTSETVASFTGEQSSFSFKVGEQEVRIAWDKVIRLESSGNNFDVWYMNAQGVYTVRVVRKDEITSLLPPIIYKVHRSHRIHLAYIKTVMADKVILVNGEEIPLGRAERQGLLTTLEKISPPLLVLSVLQNAISATTEPQTLLKRKLGGGIKTYPTI